LTGRTQEKERRAPIKQTEHHERARILYESFCENRPNDGGKKKGRLGKKKNRFLGWKSESGALIGKEQIIGYTE